MMCSLNSVLKISLVVHWLTAGGTCLIPGQGTKIPNAAQCSQKIKLYKYIAIAVTENTCSEP